jgi:hypothetical protein
MYYDDSSTKLNNINSKYFSIFLNGYKLKKSEFSFSIINSLFSIKSELFLSTLIPQKNIYVKYNRDKLDSQFDIPNVQLNIKQKEYEYSTQDFKYFAQVPVHFKAGEYPYFYLIIKDINYACYYGTSKNVFNIEGALSSTIEDVRFIVNESSIIKLDDESSCQYIYKLYGNTFIKYSGLYNIKIYEGTKIITSDNFQVQIYIAPGEFYFTNTIISGDNNINAGDIFTLTFKTKDIFGNSPNYYTLVEHFEIKFKLWNNDKKEEISESSIKYRKIKVSENNEYIEITMIITESNIYNVTAYYNNKEIELNSYFRLAINHKDCSFYNPALNISKIDYKNDFFYSGEEIEINIYCSDQYGNLIKSPGKENFKAIINNNGSMITNYHSFDDLAHIHKIHFITENEGDYVIQVMLNGKNYSDQLNIKVENFDENLFMCMNKKQVNDLKKCLDENNYRALIIDIEGKNNICMIKVKNIKRDMFLNVI